VTRRGKARADAAGELRKRAASAQRPSASPSRRVTCQSGCVVGDVEVRVGLQLDQESFAVCWEDRRCRKRGSSSIRSSIRSHTRSTGGVPRHP